MTISDFESCIKSGLRGHLVGIGGVSMSPLAEVLHSMGLQISGSDMNDSETIEHLRSIGIPVTIGHDAKNIQGTGFIIRTAAAHDDNVEIAEAKNAGIPVFERAQAWGYIMKSYKNAVCISGTHGKTTTTSMTTHILMAAEADPTVMIGGTLPLLGAGHRVGSGDTIVLESCEYHNSFHYFFPTVAVILNVDADHLDFFGTFESVKKSFHDFAALVPESGYIVCNGDDINTMDALASLDRELFTFGLGNNLRVRGENISLHGRGSSFDIIYDGNIFTHVNLSVPGLHNVYNALAAAAAAITMGVSASAVAQGLECFTGAGRRFEFKGKVNGADVYDDYAHHPGELHALLDAAFSLDYKRVIVAFQPHTYSRTKTHFDDFKKELSRADIVFLAEIYAAREQNTIGISSKDLAAVTSNATYLPTFSEIESAIRTIAQEGDIILTVGAGDIYKVGETLVK